MVIIMVDDQKPKWPWQDVEVDDPTQPDDSAPAEIWQELADKFNMPSVMVRPGNLLGLMPAPAVPTD
jgi:hypothetical protein